MEHVSVGMQNKDVGVKRMVTILMILEQQVRK